MHQFSLHFDLVAQNDASRKKYFRVLGPEHVIKIEFIMLSSTYQAGNSRVKALNKYRYNTIIYKIAALILASSTRGSSRSQPEDWRNSSRCLTSTHFLFSVYTHKESSNLFKELYLLYFVQNSA